MRFVQKAGIGLLLACAPLTGVGCASLSPKLSVIPMVARQKSAADQYRVALHAEQRQDFLAARDQYAALQQKSPQIATYAHRMAVVCTQLGDHATAKKYFEHARQLEPNNASLLIDMGYSAIVQKDYPQAETLLETAVKLRPDNSRAVNNLALAIGYQGRFDESLTTFRKSNSETQSLANLAYIHSQRNEREQAIDCYRRAIAADPKNSAAANALAQLESTPPSPTATPQLVAVAKEVTVSDQSVKDDSAPRHVSEFEAPLVQQASESQTISKETASRPRDRLSDDNEQPFFEDEEFPSRVVATAAQRTTAKAVAESEKPLIVPEEQFVPPTVVAQTAKTTSQSGTLLIPDDEVQAIPAKAASSEFAEVSWESEVVTPSKPAPPKPLVDDESDELARVFEDDANRPETKTADSDELTGLEWAKDQQATLASASSAQPATGFAESTDGLKGFCPVAIRDERRLVVASDEFTCEHQAQTYRFSSAEALEKFRSNPEEYAPIAGGLDVVAVRQGAAVANGSLDFAVWYRRRLHLFSNGESLAAFRATPRTFASVP